MAIIAGLNVKKVSVIAIRNRKYRNSLTYEVKPVLFDGCYSAAIAPVGHAAAQEPQSKQAFASIS